LFLLSTQLPHLALANTDDSQDDDDFFQMVYIGAFVLILIAGAAFFLLKKKADPEVDQLVMDDFVKGDSTEDRLLMLLDKNRADFEIADNRISEEGLLKLRQALTAHTVESFKEEKEALFKQRIEAFKKKDEPAYATALQKSTEGFMKILQESMNQAGEHYNIDVNHMNQVMQGIVTNPEKAQKVQIADQQVQRAMAPKEDLEVKQSKAEMKAILIEKMKADIQMQSALAGQKFPN
jgi:hypothetical protein